MSEKYKKEFEDWKAKTQSWLEKHPERENEFLSLSNRKIDRLYAPENASEEYGERLRSSKALFFLRGPAKEIRNPNSDWSINHFFERRGRGTKFNTLLWII